MNNFIICYAEKEIVLDKDTTNFEDKFTETIIEIAKSCNLDINNLGLVLNKTTINNLAKASESKTMLYANTVFRFRTFIEENIKDNQITVVILSD